MKVLEIGFESRVRDEIFIVKYGLQRKRGRQRETGRVRKNRDRSRGFDNRGEGGTWEVGSVCVTRIGETSNVTGGHVAIYGCCIGTTA